MEQQPQSSPNDENSIDNKPMIDIRFSAIQKMASSAMQRLVIEPTKHASDEIRAFFRPDYEEDGKKYNTSQLDIIRERHPEVRDFTSVASTNEGVSKHNRLHIPGLDIDMSDEEKKRLIIGALASAGILATAATITGLTMARAKKRLENGETLR